MSHQFKTHVENDTLIMRGSPEESVGCVLRGCVILHANEIIKVKSITLNFTGRMKVQWSERNHHYKKEAIVLEHNWTFLAQQRKLHQLSPNVYRYPFEYIIPGNLAESVDTNNKSYGGSLSYKLKAVVERPAFTPNLICHQPLHIGRDLLSDTFDPFLHIITPMQICNEWANKIDYKITVPKKIFCRGEQIPIEFSLMPKPNSESLHVRYLTCFLKEYMSFANGTTTNHHHDHTESRIIRFFRDVNFPSTGLHWHKTQIMSVPHSLNSIQCDTQNQFFRIHHKLKFTMSLINRRGELSELRATMPIDIVNGKHHHHHQEGQRGREEEEEEEEEGEVENELPTYENAWRSVLYSPLPYLDATIPPYSPMADEAYPITPSNYNIATAAATTECDYFAFQPARSSNNSLMCGILPSYHSVMIIPPAPPSQDDHNDVLLPAYE